MSQKRKRLTTILLVILALALLNYIFPRHLNISASANTYISIIDGLVGTHYQITEQEDVTKIIRQLNDLQLTNKIKFNHANNGYLYGINIVSADNNENLFKITILDKDKILFNDYSYTTNTSLLLDLLANYSAISGL